MNKLMRCNNLALAALFLASLSGCNSTPAAKFYLLEPSQAMTASQADSAPLIVMAPVRIPRYLDRSQIVSADGHNGYQLSELNRWAEGLDHNISRVLQQDLSQLVPASVVLSAPAETTALKLTVTIQELHVDAEGQANLKAQWQISRGNQLLEVERQNYRLPTGGDSFPQRVAALNRCLALLTDDIAKSLQLANHP